MNLQFDEIIKNGTKQYEKALNNPTQFLTNMYESQKDMLQEFQAFATDLPFQTMQYFKEQFEKNQDFTTKISKEFSQIPLNLESINNTVVDFNTKTLNNNLELLKDNSQKMSALLEKVSLK